VLVLGFGVGAVTAVFSVVNATFLTTLPVPEQDRLAYLYTQTPSGRTGRVMPAVLDVFKSRAAGLAEFTRHSQRTMNVSLDGDTQPTTVEVVDGLYFDVLAVRPSMGRLLMPADDVVGEQAAVVVAHDFWTRRSHSDASLVGRPVRLTSSSGTVTATVVGVAPRGFRGVADPWRPTMIWMTAAHSGSVAAHTFPIARLAAGVSHVRLQALVDAATGAAHEAMSVPTDFGRPAPEQVMTTQFTVRKASDVRVPSDPDAAPISPGLLGALVGVAVLILVVATANVSGLLLAQGMGRTVEVAVRRSLGAGSSRITRQYLTEIGLLFVAAGGIGILVATNLLALYRAAAPSATVLEVSTDWRVLLFTCLVCVVAAIPVALVVVMQTRGVNVLQALGNGMTMSRRTRIRLHHGVIVPQIAVTLALLVVAGVQVRGLLRLQFTPTGYASDGAVVVRMGLTDVRSPQSILKLPQAERNAYFESERAHRRQVLESVAAGVRTIPGVEHVGFSSTLPFRGYVDTTMQSVIAAGINTAVPVTVVKVSGGYFNALRIAQPGGPDRPFKGSDATAHGNVAVISQSLAQRLWPGGMAIGRAIALDPPNVRGPHEWLEIIGVADDVLPVLNTASERSVIYLPLSVGAGRGEFMVGAALPVLVVRGAADAGTLARQVRQVVARSSPAVEISSLQTTEEIVREILYPRHIATAILIAASVLGLVLASVGLYGLVTQSVSQRQRELGIRAALGATPRDLVRLVLRDGIRLTAYGLGAGLAISAIATRAGAAWINDPMAHEAAWPHYAPFVVATVVTLLCIVITSASLWPACRAARRDSINVLRTT
jgi:predicted permease